MRQSMSAIDAVISAALARTALRVPRRRKDNMKVRGPRSSGLGWNAFLSIILSSQVAHAASSNHILRSRARFFERNS